MKTSVVFFDDKCVLCSRTVQTIYKYDKKKRYYFASVGSEEFQKIDKTIESGVSGKETVILFQDNTVYTRSDAVLRIAVNLRFPFPMLAIGYILPRPARDAIYNLVARKRYQWFGERDHCFVPDPEMKKHYLG